MNTLEELIKMSNNDLDEDLKKAGLDLLKLRLSVSSKQNKETSKLKSLRKYIARIKTIRRANELESKNKKLQTTEATK